MSLSQNANAQPASKVFLDGTSRVTYGEARDRIGRTSTWFRELGLVRGDRVMLATEHDAELVLLFLAMIENGLVPVVVEVEASAAKLELVASVTSARAVFADRAVLARCVSRSTPSDGLHVAIEPTKRTGRLIDKLLGRGASSTSSTSYPALLGAYPASEPAGVTTDGPAYVLPTSGSTASPKAAQVSTRALRAHLATLGNVFSYNARTRLMNLLPLHHTDGLVHGPVVTWHVGGTLMRPFRFSVGTIESMLHRIHGDEVTHLVAVPTMLSLMLRFGGEFVDTFSSRNFRGIASTAGKLDSELWEQFETRFRLRITNVFGLTETVSGGLFAGPDDGSHRYGTIGREVDCEVRVVSSDGSDAEPGEIGELWIRGELIFDGYVNQRALNADIITEGWLRTGDLVVREPDGLLRFCGRAKNVIVCGGENIYPEEVSEVLSSHPEVRAAVVFGVPDRDWEELPVALVVGSPGLHRDQLIEWCAGRLPARMVPRHLKMVDALPYGPSGKVPLDEARRLFAATTDVAASAMGIEDQLRAIGARCFRVPPHTLSPLSGPHNTPGWDSLAHIGFATEIENIFGITLSPRDIMNLQSLAVADSIVRGLLAG